VTDDDHAMDNACAKSVFILRKLPKGSTAQCRPAQGSLQCDQIWPLVSTLLWLIGR